MTISRLLLISIMIKLPRLTIATLTLMTVVAARAQQSRIRDVDFRNFSYPFKPSPERDVFGKLGEVVKVHDGIAYADKFGQNVDFLYFKVAEVLYGDLNGDGQEDAAVVVIYGSNSGTLYLTDIYVYGMRGGEPVLLSDLKEDQVDKDYRNYYHDDGQQIFEAVEGGREIKAGILTVRHLADGGHCCPQQAVTLQYRLEGDRLTLVGAPLKRASAEADRKMAAFYELRN
jgi:hypothetical protein